VTPGHPRRSMRQVPTTCAAPSGCQYTHLRVPKILVAPARGWLRSRPDPEPRADTQPNNAVGRIIGVQDQRVGVGGLDYLLVRRSGQGGRSLSMDSSTIKSRTTARCGRLRTPVRIRGKLSGPPRPWPTRKRPTATTSSVAPCRPRST
jgi:hypothetical protein